MAWTTLTEADIFPRQAELEIVREQLLPGDLTGSQVLADEITQEVTTLLGYVRAAVAKGFLRQMGPDGTIPGSLVGPAAVIVRRATLGRLPGLESLHGRIREDEVTDAQRVIRDVASGANRVDEHEVIADAAPSAPSPSVKGKCLKFKRRDGDGL